MPSLQAPNWFVHELKLFDPDMRVRWSQKTNMFQLERRIAKSKIIDTTKRDAYDDDVIRAREGYILVALVKPGKFSRKIFEILRSNDLWSNGGWEAMARYIEAKELEEEEHKWEVFEGDMKAHTRELYDFIRYREGSRILNIGFPV